jgi:hypothetical protein
MSSPTPQQPVITIDTGDEVYRVGPDEAELRTYCGDLAMYDHAYLILPGSFADDREVVTDEAEQEAENVVTHIFRGELMFDTLARFMTANYFPLYLNLREVEDILRQANGRPQRQ